MLRNGDAVAGVGRVGVGCHFQRLEREFRAHSLCNLLVADPAARGEDAGLAFYPQLLAVLLSQHGGDFPIGHIHIDGLCLGQQFHAELRRFVPHRVHDHAAEGALLVVVSLGADGIKLIGEEVLAGVYLLGQRRFQFHQPVHKFARRPNGVGGQIRLDLPEHLVLHQADVVDGLALNAPLLLPLAVEGAHEGGEVRAATGYFALFQHDDFLLSVFCGSQRGHHAAASAAQHHNVAFHFFHDFISLLCAVCTI